MSKKIRFDWYGKRLLYSPELMWEDVPVRAQIVKAIALLKQSSKCKLKREMKAFMLKHWQPFLR